MKRIALAAVLAGLLIPAAAQAASAVGSFQAGSGHHMVVPNGTDGLRQVDGQLTFRQNATGPITVNGRLSGLAPSTPYVAVPYKDGACIPTPGVTAFPSGSFLSNAQGVAQPRNVVISPTAVNPLGTFTVGETRSVSVRQAVISAIAVPGIPAGTPTVPNGAQPEACDRTPVVTP